MPSADRAPERRRAQGHSSPRPRRNTRIAPPPRVTAGRGIPPSFSGRGSAFAARRRRAQNEPTRSRRRGSGRKFVRGVRQARGRGAFDVSSSRGVRCRAISGFAALLARYLSFVWLFEAEPLRADLFTRSRIIRSNHDRGLRYLPLYLARYLRLAVRLRAGRCRIRGDGGPGRHRRRLLHALERGRRGGDSGRGRPGRNPQSAAGTAPLTGADGARRRPRGGGRARSPRPAGPDPRRLRPRRPDRLSRRQFARTAAAGDAGAGRRRRSRTNGAGT